MASTATSVRPVQIPDGSFRLDADLRVPASPRGLVIFAHGSVISRLNTRIRQVAEALDAAGLATLLLDLLTREEESVDQFTREFRFDIPRLGRRVVAAVDWAKAQAELRDLPFGFFGASTGAAAALIAAAERPAESSPAAVTRSLIGPPRASSAAIMRPDAGEGKITQTGDRDANDVEVAWCALCYTARSSVHAP